VKFYCHLLLTGIWLWVQSLSVFAEPVALEPLVIYGDRILEDDLILTPGSDTIISLEDLQNAPVGSIADLLESRAGLPMASFYGDPGLGSPVIRGFGENASSRTLILLDGIPISSPDLSASPWFQFPVSGLSQISLLRGSRTVRYGSGALGGVISLETRTTKRGFSGSLETLLGSFNAETYRGQLSLPLGQWSLGLHLDRNLSEGYRENSGFDSAAWSAVLQSPQNDHFEGRWFLSGNALTFENPGSLNRSQFSDNPRQSINERFNLGDQFINQSESLRAAQNLIWNLNNDHQFTLNTSWQRRARESNFGAGSHSDRDLDTWFLEAVLTDQIDSLSWEVGLRGQFDSLRNTRFAEQARATTVGLADLDRTSIGAFALTRYELNDQLALTGGLGWDHWALRARTQDFLFQNDSALNFSRRRTGQGLSAELSLSYEIDQDWRAWLRYDRVYRFPVADEIAAYQGFVLAEPFNADLAPERGHALELGWDYEQGPWSYEGAVFSQWLEGEIAYDFRENLNVNFANTHRIGLENRLAWERDDWSFFLNHSLTFARYRSGDFRGRDVPLVPRDIFSARLNWQATETLSLGIEALRVGSSPEGNDFSNNRAELPGRWLFNGEASWNFREGLQLQLRVENIFDESYATLKYQSQWYPGNGCRFTVGLKLNF